MLIPNGFGVLVGAGDETCTATAYFVTVANGPGVRESLWVRVIRCLPPVVLFLMVLSPSAAHADELPTGPITVSAETLGFGTDIGFRGHDDTLTLTLPVAAGLVPQALDTTVQPPGDLAGGRIDVLADGVVLQRIPLATDAVSTPLSIPLDRVPVRNGAATVTLHTVLRPAGEICPTDWTGRALTLLDTRIRYAGTPRDPATVAEFLPPILDRVELYLPEQPTVAESAAAASLTTAIGSRYAGRAPEFVVLPSPPAATVGGGTFTRRIVVDENDAPARIRVLPAQATPTLELTGPAAGLAEQVRALRSDLSTLAVQETATLGGVAAVPQLASDDLTFDALGIGTPSATAVGVATVEFGVDQSRIGRRVHDVRLDLSGVYTPATSVRTGIVTVSVGDRVVDSWPADASGVIDRTVAVPDDLLTRVTPVSVSLQTSGGTSRCGLEQPVTVRLDSASRVHTAAAGTGTDFAALPQSLLPDVQVATATASLADTARAVGLLADLQALSAAPLIPEWVSVDAAVTGDKPAVIVQAEAPPTGLDLPLTLTGGRTLTLSDPNGDAGTVTFPADLDFASVQVLEDRGRTVLVASATSTAAELDRTLAWLRAEPGRWAGLAGDIVFTTPDRDPVVLSTASTPGTEAADSDDAGTVTQVLTIGGVLAAAGLLVAGIVAVVRRGRHTPGT